MATGQGQAAPPDAGGGGEHSLSSGSRRDQLCQHPVSDLWPADGERPMPAVSRPSSCCRVTVALGRQWLGGGVTTWAQPERFTRLGSWSPFPVVTWEEGRRATHGHAESDSDRAGCPLPALVSPRSWPSSPPHPQRQPGPVVTPRLPEAQPAASVLILLPGPVSSQGSVLCVTAPWEGQTLQRRLPNGSPARGGPRGDGSAPRKGPSSARHLPAAPQPVPGGGS